MTKPTNTPLERTGRLQFWLQRREWWPACWLGNRISDVRYLVWRAWGGRLDIPPPPANAVTSVRALRWTGERWEELP